MDDDTTDSLSQQEGFHDLATFSPVELTGVVSSAGVSTLREGQESVWRVSLVLVAWRANGGPVQTEPLRLRRRVREDDARTFQTRIDAESIVSIRGRLVEDTPRESPQAILDTIVDTNAADAALQDRLDDYRMPDTYDDDRFGTFVLNQGTEVYETDADWMGEDVELVLEAATAETCDEALAVASDLWDDQNEWHDRIQRYAVRELLALKNDTRREDDEPEVSATEFTDRIELQTISVEPDGEFAFWYGDGELFFGHAILICGSLSAGLTRATISG